LWRAKSRRLNTGVVPFKPDACKNKWANKWTKYWFYVMIPVIGKNKKNKEVISYPLASQMQDLEVEIAPELTKSSKTLPCTSAY
jgi:hypothetical protein